MKPFNLSTDPLQGVTLIEAGAGTGKTYTLTGIYLRLIIERGLSVDQILVVTYTKAATEELKTRIRLGLLGVKAALEKADGSDEFETMLPAHGTDRQRAAQRVRDALTDFDRSAIFTIHGFCQRLLQQYAFETGHFFDSELVQNPQPYVQELADDFWRRHISRAPYELARYAIKALKGPQELARVLGLCRYPNVRVCPGPQKVLLRAIRPWRQSARALQSLWRQSRTEIFKQLEAPGLYARPYGKCEVHPQVEGVTCRQLFLQGLFEAMDQWDGRYPIFEGAECLSQSYIARHTKKGHALPQHPFFVHCDRAIAHQHRMESEMAQHVRYLKVRLFHTANEQLTRKKIRQGVLFFDDLLLLVHQALHASRGNFLCDSVRRQYRAALVDEFQDTDPLQYEIFHRLFAHRNMLLGLIGDPKQAIYSFRGADLFSYLKAAARADGKTTLTVNWRSSPAIIDAVNTVFQRHTRPFGFSEIQFLPAVPASASACGGDLPPLTIWSLTRTDQDIRTRPVSQEEAVQRISAAVAEEICTLLSGCGKTVYQPEQIAILTRTHNQSQMVKNALAAKKVPAVLHGAGSVFHTRDALAISLLMTAIASPGNAALANALLASDYYGLPAEEFLEGNQGPSSRWQQCRAALGGDYLTWVQQGFYAMFRHWMTREKIRVRLLSLPDGERRLTNLIHLGELLHQAEVDYRLGLDGLIKWLAGRIQSEENGEDTQQLRLERDSRAVRIITMHKSKGLEFDVVFCPFVWGGVKSDPSAAVFHDPAHDHALTLALGPDIAPDHQRQARREALSENLRMLYVALTRARTRCYMAWGRINRTEISAPAYLFHGPLDCADAGERIARLQEKMNSLTDAGCLADLQQVARNSGGAIEVKPLPRDTAAVYQPRERAAGPLHCRKLRRSIRRRWRVSSFSSLTANLPVEQGERPDRDDMAQTVPDPEMRYSPFQSLFEFPKGAHAGIFFHDLLEHWDHTEKDRSVIRALIGSKLKAHGFDLRWQDAVGKMLGHLGATVLETAYHHFSLSQVPMSSRINEMSFYFPLRNFSPDDLSRVFKDKGHCGPLDIRRDWKLDQLAFTPSQGLMKGYIDTLLCHQGRYYILDWKSNFLGATPEHYRLAALQRTMVEEYYFLQYLFYSVAVDQMLRQKIPGYAYDSHFGGICYLFLRGIVPDPGGSGGIYYTVPDPRLIEALRTLLIET